MNIRRSAETKRMMSVLRSDGAREAASLALEKIIFHQFEGSDSAHDEAVLQQVLHIAGLRFRCHGTGFAALLVAKENIVKTVHDALVAFMVRSGSKDATVQAKQGVTKYRPGKHRAEPVGA